MSGEEVVECVDAARQEGSIGGSSQLVSALVLRLPDHATSSAGRSDDEIAAEFDRAFSDMYGIDIDEFLALRDDADAATTDRLGDPPGLGERASDEWFVQRDMTLLMLWNERHPAGARAFCELIEEGG